MGSGRVRPPSRVPISHFVDPTRSHTGGGPLPETGPRRLVGSKDLHLPPQSWTENRGTQDV